MLFKDQLYIDIVVQLSPSFISKTFFILQNWNFLPVELPIHLSSQPLVTTFLFSIFTYLTALSTSLEWNYMVFVPFWWAYFTSVMSSRFIRVVERGISFPLRLNNIPLCGVCVCVCDCVYTHTHTYIYIPNLFYLFLCPQTLALLSPFGCCQ